MTDEIAFFAIRDTLKSFKDVDHLISSLIQVPKKPNIKFAEQSINNVITLKYTVKLVEPLRAAVQSCIDKVNGTTAGRGGARRGNRTNNQQHFEDDGETVKGGGEDDGDTSSSANAHAALDSRCSFLDAIVTILSDPDIEWIDDRIDQVINEDVTLQKNPLGLRNQRCYAVKSVSMFGRMKADNR